MSPTMVFKGDKPFFIVGAPGGTTITMGNLQAILNAVDFGMTAQEAVSAPRLCATSDTIEITNIDAEFECARRDDHAVLRLGERLLRLPALVETQRAVRHECVDLKALEFVAELLGALTAIDEHKSLFATVQA